MKEKKLECLHKSKIQIPQSLSYRNVILRKILQVILLVKRIIDIFYNSS